MHQQTLIQMLVWTRHCPGNCPEISFSARANVTKLVAAVMASGMQAEILLDNASYDVLKHMLAAKNAYPNEAGL